MKRQTSIGLIALLWLLPAGSAPAAEPAPSVVIVVFDELPTVSLLSADRSIDAAMVPNFAALAATSTWASGASTVATRLLEFIPALATGRMPGPERKLAIRAEYPENLFTWLEATHTLNVIEGQSMLRPDPRSAAAQAHWLTMVRHDKHRVPDQALVFRRFVREVDSRGPRREGEKPSLDFIHVTLPYAPWRNTASGRDYSPTRMTGNFASIWSEDPFHAEDAWRRHLAEVRLADELLGTLVASLKQQGRFDEALILVTADYGASFWPGESRRVAGRTGHPEDVLVVPLFVKRPGQTEGDVVRSVVQTIDILPTVADVLAMEPGWKMDGCSIFDAACERPSERRTMRLDGGPSARQIDVYPADLPERRGTLDRKHAIFPDTAHVEASWPAGRLESWRGRTLDALPIVATGAPAGQLSVTRGVNDWNMARGGARFVGSLTVAPAAQEPGDTHWVALALNRQLEALVPAVHDRRNRLLVQAMLPESRLDVSVNQLDAFLVSGQDDAATLLPLELIRGRRR